MANDRLGGMQGPDSPLTGPAGTRGQAAPLMEATGVRREFRSGPSLLHVLRGVDLTIGRGEIIAVVGASGTGKSTLLHILGTLDRPDGGRVLFRGQDLFGLGEEALAEFRNRNLGFVFQFHHLLPEFTAAENVMMPGLIRGESRREARRRAAGLLDEVGLTERIEHKPGELSGGEQQRVALARSLYAAPSLVLADEPTGNLDPETARGLHTLMYDLARRHGQSWIVVTHNEQLAGMADRRVEMSAGLLRERPASAPAREIPRDEMPELR